MPYVRAESVKIECDEGRTVLEVEDVEGERVTIDIHGIDLDAFYDQVKARVGPYLREMHEAQVAHGAAKRAEFDAHESGYELSNPKHPQFHSVHADIWDARDGK
jgi:hypothetical protein